MSTQDAPHHAHTLPGFDFLSKLSQHGASGLGGGAAALPGLPPMSHWIAPVFDPDELDKRIHDLRAVHFWLDQNTKALAATIQALELQKMTLLTLRGMNVSMQEMAESFVVKPAPAAQAAPDAARANAGWPQSAHAAQSAQSAQGDPAPAAPQAAAADAPAAPAQTGTMPPAVDPMQWWGALTEQFQTIANEALRDMSAHASRAAEQMAHSVQAGTDAMASAQAAAAAAPSEAAATPRASAPPQSARAKPRKRPPPAPRAARASS
ncbi:MAG: PhaM family polyhydroxyalkanoate granule multifunctional regulatory protein [Pseudomonadota bacterium]|jgi:hypothetical protein